MHVFVTGGAGYIGSHVLLHLQEAGYKATTFDNLATGRRSAVAYGEFVEGDIVDYRALASAIEESRPDAIVHLAALSNLRESVEQPIKYHHNNTVGTLNVLEASREAGINKIVFSSSAAVYGSPGPTALSENAPLAPISPYGTSKLMGETFLKEYAASSECKYVALRYFNAAGADIKGRAGESTEDAWHLIKIACQAATGKRDGVVIYGEGHETPDGTCVRDYVHVSDIARAHLDALEYLSSHGQSEVLNIGYGRGISVRQVVDTVKRISGVDFAVTSGPPRPGDPPSLMANSDRARNVIDWQPLHDDLDTIIQSALSWERELKKATSRA